MDNSLVCPSFACCKEPCAERLKKALPCRLVRGLLFVVTLPALACYFLLCARATAEGAAIPLLPYQETVQQLAGASITYWFLTLAAIAIASWTWILKWVINQLEQQRAANAEVTARLITYMEKDHADMRLVLGKVSDVLEKVARRLPEGGK